MCLIIATPKATTLEGAYTEQELLSAAARNNNGVGVMYIDKDNNFVMEKLTPPDGKEEQEASVQAKFIEEHRAKAGDGPFAAHLRFKTHGPVEDLNTHPHPVITEEDGIDGGKYKLYMMHNGVISNSGTYNKSNKLDKEEYSDTVRFIQTVLRPILLCNQDVLYTEEFQELLSKYIGAGSKLTFLDTKGRMIFVNEKAGTWRKDVWYSTISYLNTPKPYSGGGYCGNSHADYYANWWKNQDLGKGKGGSTKNTKGSVVNLGASGLVLPCKDSHAFGKEASNILATGFKANVKRFLDGSIRLKDEPNLDSQVIRNKMERVVDTWIGFTQPQLKHLCASAVLDVAEVLYYLIQQHEFDAEMFENDEHDEYSNMLIIKDISFVDTYEFIKDFTDAQREKMLDTFLNFDYPWQVEEESKANSTKDK